MISRIARLVYAQVCRLIAALGETSADMVLM